MDYFLRNIFFSALKVMLCLKLFFSYISSFAFPISYPKICMVLGKGGKNDHSFNESAASGFELAQKNLQISPESKFVEPRFDSQIPLFLNHFSFDSKCDLIIAIGFASSSYVFKIAPKFPDKKYLVIDYNIEYEVFSKNIRSVSFEENQGSFLMGVIAGSKTITQKVGFVGGMDLPVIHRFELGYVSGAKYVNPKIQITSTYVGLTPEAWNNPKKAKNLAISQFKADADIIFQVAAASGQGVFDAAEQLNNSQPQIKHYAIGVNSNQNWLNPKVILTSMEKKIDIAVYNSIKDLIENKFTSGHVIFDLKAGGVQWALDQYNKKLFSEKEIKFVNYIRDEIINNKIIVPNYFKNKNKIKEIFNK